MPRKPRIDSISAQVEVMAKGARALCAPDHAPLHADAGPFWLDILRARAASEWTDHDLTYASDLANAMAQLVDNRKRLRAEGEVLSTSGGNPCANPRVAIVHGLTSQIKAMRQSLSIHGRSQGEARDVGKRREMAKAIEAANPLEDDLLARPSTIQ